MVRGWALRELARFREGCRDNLISCLKSFLDTESGPSKIWVDCPHAKKPSRTLPNWVHHFFTPLIEELKKPFECPLIAPSSIREKYLEALRKHAAPDRCTFCLGMHAMKGEWYYKQLEDALDEAIEEASVVFTFREYSQSLTIDFAFFQTPIISA
ncbi:hypothetical protein EI94DRAFT_1808440 [Lactarius quietus]|nr:hypothetical protein EI94DRAFT_1808440 [Lactarius quietus]